MARKSEEVKVILGEGVVTLNYRKGTEITVGNILGIEGEEGSRKIYLDRLLHGPHEREFCGWNVKGAVSTILREQPKKTIAVTTL